MILLLGGTSEAVPIAEALRTEGYAVLLSTATTMAPQAKVPTGVERRSGMLDAEAMAALIRDRSIRALVDATHPFAEEASRNACGACRETGVPYLPYERPGALLPSPGIHWTTTHDRGAAFAFAFGTPVLLTIGIRNLAPYVAQARRHGIPMTARVLDHPASIESCLREGLAEEEVACANGPFSVEENIALIEKHRIGVLVTKESGEAGGVKAKIEAARKTGCQAVVIRRPRRPQAGYASIPALLAAVKKSFNESA